MKNFKGLLLAIVSSATFGFIPLFSVPLLTGGVDLSSMCFYRFLISTIAMALVIIVQRKVICKEWKQKLKDYFLTTKKEFFSLFLLSFFYAGTSIFLAASYEFMPTGIATTIHFLYPVLVTTIMILFFHEKLSVMKAIAIVMAIAGVFFLCGGLDIISGKVSGNTINPIGIGIVLITVCTYATYIVGVNNSKVLMKMDGMKMTFYVLLFSCFIFFCNVMVRGAHFAPLTTSRQWIDIIGLAIIATLMSDFALIYAIQMIGSTITAILGCMEPLTAVILGILFLGESLHTSHVIGIVMVFVAVYLIIMAKQRIKTEQ